MSDSVNNAAAVSLQKIYRSYHTRRILADTAVLAEELWWQVIDCSRFQRCSTSFFSYPSTAASRWNWVGRCSPPYFKRLKAKKLAFDTWIEAIDPRHRYGHNLHTYYEIWRMSDSGQPFFFWLDVGEGKDLDIEDCPRLKLNKELVKYLGPQEREQYEYILVDGKIVHKLSGEFLDTSESSKCIFVMSPCKKLYTGEKQKGKFHHSSFLAGGATLAAGRLKAEDGTLKIMKVLR